MVLQLWMAMVDAVSLAFLSWVSQFTSAALLTRQIERRVGRLNTTMTEQDRKTLGMAPQGRRV